MEIGSARVLKRLDKEKEFTYHEVASQVTHQQRTVRAGSLVAVFAYYYII